MGYDECSGDYVEQCFCFTIDSTDQRIQSKLCSTEGSILTRDVRIYTIFYYMCLCLCVYVHARKCLFRVLVCIHVHVCYAILA